MDKDLELRRLNLLVKFLYFNLTQERLGGEVYQAFLDSQYPVLDKVLAALGDDVDQSLSREQALELFPGALNDEQAN